MRPTEYLDDVEALLLRGMPPPTRPTEPAPPSPDDPPDDDACSLCPPGGPQCGCGGAR